jgi:hypothetical protein
MATRFINSVADIVYLVLTIIVALHIRKLELTQISHLGFHGLRTYVEGARGSYTAESTDTSSFRYDAVETIGEAVSFACWYITACFLRAGVVGVVGNTLIPDSIAAISSPGDGREETHCCDCNCVPHHEKFCKRTNLESVGEKVRCW